MLGYAYAPDAQALYDPYVTTPFGAPDPPLQAAAFDAATRNIVEDTSVTGVYVWALSTP